MGTCYEYEMLIKRTGGLTGFTLKHKIFRLGKNKMEKKQLLTPGVEYYKHDGTQI